MARVEKHGCLFKMNRLRTECKCGCIYLTHKRKIQINRYSSFFKNNLHDGEIYFITQCPECFNENSQWATEMLSEVIQTKEDA